MWQKILFLNIRKLEWKFGRMYNVRKMRSLFYVYGSAMVLEREILKSSNFWIKKVFKIFRSSLSGSLSLSSTEVSDYKESI